MEWNSETFTLLFSFWNENDSGIRKTRRKIYQNQKPNPSSWKVSKNRIRKRRCDAQRCLRSPLINPVISGGCWRRSKRRKRRKRRERRERRRRAYWKRSKSRGNGVSQHPSINDDDHLQPFSKWELLLFPWPHSVPFWLLALIANRQLETPKNPNKNVPHNCPEEPQQWLRLPSPLPPSPLTLLKILQDGQKESFINSFS